MLLLIALLFQCGASSSIAVSTSPIVATLTSTSVVPEYVSYSISIATFNTTTGDLTVVPVTTTYESHDRILTSTNGSSTSLANQTAFLTTVTRAFSSAGPPSSTITRLVTSTIAYDTLTSTVASSTRVAAVSAPAKPSSLSSATKAGIGVGAAIGGATLVFLAFWLGYILSRRRNRHRAAQNLRNQNLWDDIPEPSLEPRDPDQVYELADSDNSESGSKESDASLASQARARELMRSPISPLSPTSMAEILSNPMFEKFGNPRHEKG